MEALQKGYDCSGFKRISQNIIGFIADRGPAAAQGN